MLSVARGRYAGGMAKTAEELLENIPHVSVQDTADRLGVEPSRIKQLIKENVLLGLRHGGELHILEETLVELPANRQFVAELRTPGSDEPRLVRATDEPLPTLRGSVMLLADGGFSNEEIIDWLWTENPWLEARPIQMLREGSHRAVNRVAATQAW